MAANASERLHAIAARLKAEGQRGLQREMAGTMRTAARPLISAAEQAARERLPKSGGLNELVADRHTTVSVLTGPRSAGVRLKRPRKDAASYQTNRAYIYHPNRGAAERGLTRKDEEYWAPKQELPAAEGWWNDTLAEKSPEVTPLLVAEMNRVARRIQGGYY